MVRDSKHECSTRTMILWRLADLVLFCLCCRYDDLGGISGILQEVRELIEYPLVHPEVYAHLGIEPVRTKTRQSFAYFAVLVLFNAVIQC